MGYLKGGCHTFQAVSPIRTRMNVSRTSYFVITNASNCWHDRCLAGKLTWIHAIIYKSRAANEGCVRRRQSACAVAIFFNDLFTDSAKAVSPRGVFHSMSRLLDSIESEARSRGSASAERSPPGGGHRIPNQGGIELIHKQEDREPLSVSHIPILYRPQYSLLSF